MITVGEVLSDAAIEAGVLSPGEDLPAEDTQFALRTLNRMVERWNSERLMIYTLNRNVFTLVALQQSYTLGTGGNFNIPRPVKMDMISVIPVGGLPEIPIRDMSDEEWRGIAVKQTQSAFPTMVWWDGNTPLNTAYFWPVPTTAAQVVIYSWGRISALTGLTTQLQFPDGWEEAIVTNLALMLCSSYGKTPSQVLMSRASTSKNSIQNLNTEPMYIRSDIAGTGNGSSMAIRSFGLQVDRM